MLSTSILSSPSGPKELLTMFAMAKAAVTDPMHHLSRRLTTTEPRTILIPYILPWHAVTTEKRASSRITLEHLAYRSRTVADICVAAACLRKIASYGSRGSDFAHLQVDPLASINLNDVLPFEKYQTSPPPCTSNAHQHLWVRCVFGDMILLGNNYPDAGAC